MPPLRSAPSCTYGQTKASRLGTSVHVIFFTCVFTCVGGNPRMQMPSGLHKRAQGCRSKQTTSRSSPLRRPVTPPPSPPTPSSDYSEKNLLGFSLTGPQGQRRRGRQARESIFKRHIGSRSGVKGRRASPGGPEEARRRWVLLQTARSLLMGGDPTNSSGTVVRIAAATADNAEENRWHTVE